MDDAKKFIEEVIALGKKYGMAIGHQDEHGAFEIRDYTDRDADWLRQADDRRKQADKGAASGRLD